MNLNSRLCLLSVVLAAFLANNPATAAERCFSNLNLSVPNSTEGLYVNLVSGVSAPNEGGAPGFDIDIYAAASTNPSGQLRFYWGPESSGGAGVALLADTYAVLAAGQLIGPNSLFTRAAFTGNTAAWQAGVTGYLGLRFRNESAQAIHYGWLQLSTSAALGFPATINGWCYEDSGAAISTPDADVYFNSGFEF